MSEEREKQLASVGMRFHSLNLRLDHGLQVLLELEGVPVKARQAVKEYMGGVIGHLRRIEAEVSKLCNEPEWEPLPEPSKTLPEIDLEQ